MNDSHEILHDLIRNGEYIVYFLANYAEKN